MKLISFTVLGKCASKANGRKITRYAGIIKSDAARAFADEFKYQAPRVEEWITDDVMLVCKIYYSSLRNDLDESLVMDGLEKAKIIKNDKQIKFKIIEHGLDRDNPRVVIALRSLSDKNDCPWREE